MKKACKSFLSVILALTLSLSLGLSIFAADSAKDNSAYGKYTTVFVHGLMGWGDDDGVNSAVPYWGMTAGSMIKHLEARGYKTAVASVGPISSCWDRCCELYAQLTGTRVDYGAAHCEETLENFRENGIELNHSRYGRDYTGKAIVENWGPGIDNKINLVGHSFGGPTSVMLLHLLAEGDEEEREYAKKQAEIYGGSWKDYCSPLFWGDYNGENLINSVTSLAGVLNGTTFIDSCDTATQLTMRFTALLANTLGDTAVNRLYDFQLEQFGLTSTPTVDYKYMLNLIDSYKFLDGKDNAIYDLSIKGCNELKHGWQTYDNVFYFAYAGNTTHETAFGTHLPNADTWLPLSVFAVFMGSYTDKNEVVLDTNGNGFCVIDKAWLSNDGMVNTVSSEYVFGNAHKTWDNCVEPGIWITMPHYGFDHMDFCGGLLEPTQNNAEATAFFDEIINNIEQTYSFGSLPKAPVLKGTSKSLLGKTYIQLTWDKIDGATCYRIYKATSEGGVFKLLDTVSATSLKDYLTVKKHTYYYKIAAVKGDKTEITSPMSAVITVRCS